MSCVNDDLKSAFVHVPKCAGTSMSNIDWNLGSGHLTLHDLFVIHPKKVKVFTKWCFVRNPYSRLVSSFENCYELKNEGYSFERLVNTLYDNRKQLDGLDYVSWASFPTMGLPISRIHFLPMHLLTNFRNINMDFVGKYENLYADWHEICQLLKVKYQPLDRHNPGPKYDYRKYYTPDLQKKVQEIFKPDFEQFGYSTIL